MIRIKVCGMKYAGNIRDVAETGADYLGFIFYPSSPRYVGDTPDLSIIDLVPAPVSRIGVFVNEAPGSVKAKADQFRLHMVQLHGSETPDYCSKLCSPAIKVMKAFGVDEAFNFSLCDEYASVCDYYLFDTRTTAHGGSGSKFNWEKLSEYHGKPAFFLSGGIGPGDVQALKKIKHNKLFAVDINSRFETRPGLKDAAKIRTFIRDLKADNNRKK